MPLIKDIQAFNAYLAVDGWDGLPEAEAPDSECQSKTRSATSADDDHIDALLEWSRKDDLWDIYQAWLVAEEPRGPEPEHEGNPGPTPVPPEGYNDVEHGSWAPFERPVGEDEDEIPTLYRELDETTPEELWQGSYAYHSGYDMPEPELGPGETTTLGENRIDATWNSVTYFQGTVRFRREVVYISKDMAGNLNTVRDPVGDPFPIDKTHPIEDNPGLVPTFDFTLSGDRYECTPTTRTFFGGEEIADNGGVGIVGTYTGLPGPPPYDGPEPSEGWSITRSNQSTETLSSGVDKATVKTRAEGKLPVGWPDPPEEAECVSRLDVTWPKIEDMFSGGDPEAEPSVLPSWPECDSPLLPLPALGTVEITLARYRYGIPSLWQAWQERKDAFDAWVLAGSDPEALVADPGPRRTTFRIRWQECFFPKVWEDWKELKDAFDVATAAHAAWLAEGSEGEEPVVPPDPTADEPAEQPVLGAWKTWVWNSVQTEPFDPAWHEIPLPTVAGETRRVNLGSIDYDSKYGIKYTSHGEAYPVLPAAPP